MEGKESVKWSRGYQAACQAAQAGATGLPRAQVLVRAMRERTLVEVRQRVWDWLPKQAVAGQGEVNVPAKPGRRARVARLALRFAEVELEPPTNERRLDRVKVWAVLAQEIGAGKGVEPISWQLLTTLPVPVLRARWRSCAGMRNAFRSKCSTAL
jgi:hypothetical protein